MNYYENIKDHLIRNEINHRIKDYSKNKSDLETYYNVGKLLIEAQGKEKRAKYGDGLIKEYSTRLTKELGKGYSTRSLKRMRSFFLLIQKGTPLVAQLSWSNYIQLLNLNDINKVKYYVELCKKSNLTKRQLQEKIKNKEYERLSNETKNKIISNSKMDIVDTVKNPIIINNLKKLDVYKEKILQELIIDDLDNFLDELGQGYCYIKKEYRIKMGNSYNYIDILLYNKIYKCYVVIELKIGKLKKEHIGQIQTYMNYIDSNLKEISDNKTIGIILCKENNELIIKYSSDEKILSREYVIN